MNLAHKKWVWIVAVLMMPICIIGIYVTHLLWNFPLERLESLEVREERSKEQDTGPQNQLEEGALVDASELSAYLIFSETARSAREWIAGKIADGSMERGKGNKLVIKRSLSLGPPIKNDCAIVYCFQNRLEFGDIPSIFWKGLIGIEDYRFLGHQGVDVISIARAIVVDIAKMRLEQGGSTLTQQLVKNIFLGQEKSFGRKFKEMVYSLYLEWRWEKEDILEAYFNEVFWGTLQGLRAKGLYSASLLYFSRPPSELDAYQASVLIALLKGPAHFSPLTHPDRLKQRVSVVYEKLLQLQLISRNIDPPWTDSQWEDWLKQLHKQKEERPYFAFWPMSKMGNGPLNHYQSYVFHHKAEVMLAEMKKRAKTQDLDLAIKAYVRSTQAEGDQEFAYYSKYERDLPKALDQEKHQIGSTIKPIVYGMFLSHGMSWDKMVPTTPITLKLKSGAWSPRDAHKIEQTEVSVLDALVNSYNVPLIHLAQEAGMDALETELKGYLPDLRTPLKEFPAQLLGSVELSVKELWKVYAQFVAKQCSMPPETARTNVLYTLSDPKITTVRNVVGEEVGQLNFFGKTGTTNKGLDNWYVYFDGEALGIIWVGKEGNRQNQSLPFYGSSTAFKLFEGLARDGGQQFNEFHCGQAVQEPSEEAL